MNEFNDKPGPREAAAFSQLSREKTPPEFLEQRIVDALSKSHLLRSSFFRWQRRLTVIGPILAASAALLVLGAIFGTQWKSAVTGKQDLPKFMLLLRNSPRELATRSPDERLQRVREYSAWAKGLHQKGVLVEGEKLKDETSMLNVIDGRPVVTGMEAETKGRAVAGYFLIRARGYPEAIQIAENCPHTKYGGTIEIRQIDSIGQRSN